MPITQLTLTLGDEIFVDFEVPQQIGEIGGIQLVAQHDFPGGRRTQQLFGAFPAEIQWTGYFTGTAALTRMRVVDRLRIAGREVQLSFGNTQLLGVVLEFVAEPRHQWLVPYRIRFMPRVDLSYLTQGDEFLSVFALINDALVALTNLVLLIAPSGGQGATHAASDSSFTEVYVPLPPSIAPPLTSLINGTYDALAAALGIVGDISFSDAKQIYADATAVLAVAQPLSQSGDPTIASPALDVIGYVGTITSAVASPSTANTTTLQVINPNLYRIAAQYYGDATKWQIIADASGISPPDPMPIGGFTLTIPAVTH